MAQDVLENAIHDWMSDRWNEAWHNSREPLWHLSADLTDVLRAALGKGKGGAGIPTVIRELKKATNKGRRL